MKSLLLVVFCAVLTAGTGHGRSCCVSFSDDREFNLPFTGSVDVNTGGVGAISVSGWENAYVLVRAHVSGNGGDWLEARVVALSVEIAIDGGKVVASGPKGKSWGVGFEVFVPREAGVETKT